MQPKLNVKQVLLLMPFLLIFFFSLRTYAQENNAYVNAGLPVPTVTSDVPDYSPGDVAHITGTGWNLDQSVHIEFKETPDYPDYHIYDVDVDSLGHWQLDYNIELRHLGVSFTVEVTGKQSQVISKCFFEDGPATTTLTVTNTIGVYGGNVTLVAKLTKLVGTTTSGVSGASIAFFLNGSSKAIANTDQNGTAIVQGVSIANINASTNPYSGYIAATYGGNASIALPAANGSGDLIVNKAKANIRIDANAVNYDGKPHGLTGNATGVAGEVLTASLNLGGTVTDYPGGPITWTFAGGSNYRDSTGTNLFVINKGDANVRVDGWLGSYDGKSHYATFSASGAGGIDLTSSLTLTGGPYTDFPGGKINWTFSGGNNYKDLTSSVNITINKADAKVRVDGYTVGYDGKPHSAIYSATGVVGEDLLPSLTFTGGPYTDFPGGNISWNFAGGNNYKDLSSTVTINITKANPTVSLNVSEYTYDAKAHGIVSAIITGVNGIDLGGTISYAGVSPTIYSSSDAPTSAGNYLASISYPGSNNYNPANGVKGYFINKAKASVTPVANSKIYGTLDPTLTGSSSGFVASDGVAVTYSRAAGESVATSPYFISATLSPVAILSNYDITYNTANFTITPAAITIIPDALSKTFGADDPLLTYTITNGSVLFGDTCTGSLARASGENVGNYPINIGTLSLGSNYSITLPPTNFTITQRAITITPKLAGKVYGEVDPALAYSITSGSLMTGDLASGSLARTAGENAGSYPINIGSLTFGTNYMITLMPGNFTVSQRAITITPDALVKTYGNPDPDFTYSIVGSLISGDVVSGKLGRTAGENVGTYPITIGTLSYGSNYTIALAPVMFVINTRAITVTASSATKTYGDIDPNLAYLVTTGKLVVGDAFFGSLTRAVGESAGDYLINIGTLTLGSNYVITFVPANLTITQRAITVTANPQSKVLGSVDPPLTYKITTGNLVNGDGFSGSLSRTAGESVGSYQINQGTVTLSTNYAITFVPAKLTIIAPTTTPIVTSGTQTNVTCFAGNNGSATVVATGGTGTYTYSWTPSVGTGATVSSLPAGTYTVVVKDTKGGTATKVFTITQPLAPFNVTKETFPTQFNTGFGTSLVNKTFVGTSGTWTANSNANGSVVVLQPYYSPSTSYALKIVNFKTKGTPGGGSGTASATSDKLNLMGACCPDDVKMNFTLWTYTCTAGDTKASLGIDFSTDNGASWTTVWSKTSAQLFTSCGSNGKTYISIPIPVVYQNANFKYRFSGNMAADDAYNFYLFIDDIDINSCSSLPSSIGDFIWNDTNGNGTQEATEAGIAGAIVKLTKPGGAIATATTDSKGSYRFSNLSTGKYVVNFVTPLGFAPSASKQGNNDAIDSDPLNGSISVTLGGNENINTIDAGFTTHSYCKNNCTHVCNHSNCGVNHLSCRNNCTHTTCSHSNCGNHITCRNNCNHTNCGHSNCGNVSSSMRSTEPIIVAISASQSYNTVQHFTANSPKSSIKVYPNPTTGQFNVEIANLKVRKATVMVVDEKGLLIAQKPLVVVPGQMLTVSFNLSNSNPGVYFIKVICDYSSLLTDRVILVK
jgi:hypothetical protein